MEIAENRGENACVNSKVFLNRPFGALAGAAQHKTSLLKLACQEQL
jgi:hypothetical protein